MAQAPHYIQAITLTHKQLILQQVMMCQRIMSGFDAKPETINAQIGKYDFTKSAHEGKSVALAVIALEAIARPVIGEEFYKRTAKLFEQAFEPHPYPYRDSNNSPKQKTGYKYLAPDPDVQFEGIMLIMKYYAELLAAIFTLPDFTDIKYIRDKGWTSDEKKPYQIVEDEPKWTTSSFNK